MITESSVLNTRYRLDKKIGQGGFAQVFLSTDQLLKRRVAVKVLNSDLTEDDESFLIRFEREAQSVAALDHPNILSIYDYGQAENTAYLVMPYVEGGTIHDRLRREKRLSLQAASNYLQQAAAALDYAHRRNIVHRDIKPQNMMLRMEDDRLLLGDFGIAKVLGGTSSGQSHTGVMGTLAYMSPEQLEGNVTTVTDVYALGCVLFQMLTGQLPYMGGTEQVMMGHILKPVPSIYERSQGQISAALQPIFDRAMAKNPAERFQTAGEMVQAYLAIVPPTGNVYTSGRPSPSLVNVPLVQPPTGQPQVTPTNSNSQQMPTVMNNFIPASDKPSASLLNQSNPVGISNNFNSSYPTVQPTQPPTAAQATVLTPKTKGPNVALLAGMGGGIALLVVVVLGVILLSSGSKGANPTATSAPASTVIAVNPTTAAPSAGATTPASNPTAATTGGTSTTAAADPAAASLKEANDTFFVKGDLNAGIARFRSLTQSYPNNAKVWRDYGHALHLWNRDAGGIEPLVKATQLDPKDALAYLYLTDTTLDNYRYKDAEQAAKTAAQLDPNGWMGHAALASYYNKVYKKAEAKTELDAMQKAAGSATSDPYYNWLLSNVLFTEEEYKGALDSIDKTIVAWPRLPSALTLKGVYLIYAPGEAGDQPKGVQMLGDALKLQPQSSTILTELAYYYTFIAGDDVNGEKYARDAININSSEPKAINALAYVLSKKKNYTEAYKQFDNCIKLDDLRFECYTNWALALMDEASDLTIANKKTEATNAFKSAVEKAQKALAIVPNDPDINWVVGVTYFKTADYKNAQAAFQKAISVAPNVASYYGWLGSAYFEDGQKEKARTEYNKGLAIDPNDEAIKDLGKKLK